MQKKILIIDDDHDLVRSFQVMLENNDYYVITASNSKEGFEKLKNEKPDLLILDVMMNTNLEGYNMLHTIKKEPDMKDLPIILLTGMLDTMGVNLVSGVDDEKMFPNVTFHDKPIYPAVLLELIKGLIRVCP
ncbi:MAG: response regulator [Bacteroidales bacterium]|jgi:CheY-like chemotaxis protein